MDAKADLAVKRDDEHSRYAAEVNGEQALIDFQPAGPGVLDLRHTEVPVSLQGHGVGEELVRQTLDDIRARGERIIPTCRFVAAFLRHHPEYGDLVEQ